MFVILLILIVEFLTTGGNVGFRKNQKIVFKIQCLILRVKKPTIQPLDIKLPIILSLRLNSLE